MPRINCNTEWRFGDLLGNIELSEITGADKLIAGVANLAGECSPGDLFIAVRGAKNDGHHFVEQAIARGAVALVLDRESQLPQLPAEVAVARVPSTRRLVSILAARAAGEPARQMDIIGITGTNGKTTTNWLVHELLLVTGRNSLRIGTLGVSANIAGENEPVLFNDDGLTTPDPIDLQRLLRAALGEGIRYGVMESSSHALDQGRVEGIPFAVGAFTNLTRDHLDYHLDMERYAAAKQRLWTLLRPIDGAAVINLDSQWGGQFLEVARRQAVSKIITFSRQGSLNPDIQILNLEQSINGSTLTLDHAGERVRLHSKFIGDHNAENLTTAYGILRSLGISSSEIVRALPNIPQVPGRLEGIGGSSRHVFVDYAHTPDALERAIAAVRPLVTGKLWVLFGCGGDRDRGKRPQMMAVARRLADKVVVTSDNPRTEEPRAIIADILASGERADLVEVDRKVAIAQALAQSAPGDTLIIAGKGHEQYQIIGTTKNYFSDQRIARDELQKMGDCLDVDQSNTQ